MICSSCGHIGNEKEFTKNNRSGIDVGRCKKCKAGIDKAYRIKKDYMPESFELKPDLLNRKKINIGVLRLQKIIDRRLGKKSNRLELNFGIKAILSELKEPYEVCYPETINQYKFVLISLTSVMDVENLIYTFEKYCPKIVTAKIIIGGFGVINIKLIVNYIDIAVFGRAEGQINDIISGFSFKNVWRKQYDPAILKQYEIRQPQYLLKGENSIGCHNRCAYCQYTHIRKTIGKAVKYNPGQGISIPETDWNSLVIDKPGKYITAWDGWSEITRRRVNKSITDKDIISKLIKIGNNKKIKKTVSLKIFQIVGYPWETSQSVLEDINQIKIMIAAIDKKIINNIVIAFLVTPFGPEPLTPMQHEPANIYIDWRSLLSGMKIYYGRHIKAFIITAISGPFTLLKRVWINRAKISDIDKFKKIVFNSKIKRMPERYKIKWLINNRAINPNLFGTIERNESDYLRVRRAGLFSAALVV